MRILQNQSSYLGERLIKRMLIMKFLHKKWVRNDLVPTKVDLQDREISQILYIMASICWRGPNYNPTSSYLQVVIVTVWVGFYSKCSKCKHNHVARGYSDSPNTIPVMWVVSWVTWTRKFTVVLTS